MEIDKERKNGKRGTATKNRRRHYGVTGLCIIDTCAQVPVEESHSVAHYFCKFVSLC